MKRFAHDRDEERSESERHLCNLYVYRLDTPHRIHRQYRFFSLMLRRCEKSYFLANVRHICVVAFNEGETQRMQDSFIAACIRENGVKIQ